MIPLTKGKFALVDEADAELIHAYAWHAVEAQQGSWYSRGSVPTGLPKPARRGIYMHQLITGLLGADHVNGNGLDNRRVNLRPASQSQNNANQGLQRNNASGYKGVSRHGSGWRATIKVDRRHFCLGSYADPVDAARAYNRAALEAWGEYAWLNPV